jgi:hypothetical protein
MPYPEKFLHVLYARKSGKTLNNPKLDKISPQKADELLTESKGKALRGGK